MTIKNDSFKAKILAFHSENAEFFHFLARSSRIIFPALLIYALTAADALAQNPFGNGVQEASSTANGWVKLALWGLPFLGFFCGLLTFWKFRKKDESWTRELVFTLVCFGLWAPLMATAWDTGNNKGSYDNLDDFRIER